jgi:hypothetical protein
MPMRRLTTAGGRKKLCDSLIAADDEGAIDGCWAPTSKVDNILTSGTNGYGSAHLIFCPFDFEGGRLNADVLPLGGGS